MATATATPPTHSSADLARRRDETRAELATTQAALGLAIADDDPKAKGLAVKVATLRGELDGYDLAVTVATDRERAAAAEAARLARVATATAYYARFADLLETLVPLAERAKALADEREAILRSDVFPELAARSVELRELGLFHGLFTPHGMYLESTDPEDLRTTARQAREYAAGIEAKGG